MIQKIIKKILWELYSRYSPKKFWDIWAGTFMDDPWQVQIHQQHKWILEKVKETNPKNILEVGCGFGRNIKFLIENGFPGQNISGVDLSSEMIKKARSYIKNNDVLLQTADASALPFLDKEFDVVLVHGVFMHIKPGLIDLSINEVLRVTKHFMIVVEQNYGGNKYTFIHNYKKIFQKQKVSIKDYVHDTENGLDYFLIAK